MIPSVGSRARDENMHTIRTGNRLFVDEEKYALCQNEDINGTTSVSLFRTCPRSSGMEV